MLSNLSNAEESNNAIKLYVKKKSFNKKYANETVAIKLNCLELKCFLLFTKLKRNNPINPSINKIVKNLEYDAFSTTADKLPRLRVVEKKTKYCTKG